LKMKMLSTSPRRPDTASDASAASAPPE
jgi:hypothetical protein